MKKIAALIILVLTASVGAASLDCAVEADGRIILARPGEKPFAVFFPVMQRAPGADPERLTLTVNEVKDGVLHQRYECEQYALILTAVPDTEHPWIKVTTAVENLTGQTSRVRVTYHLVPFDSAVEYPDLISFRRDNAVQPLLDGFSTQVPNLVWTWGTKLFCRFPEEFCTDETYGIDPITGAQILMSRKRLGQDQEFDGIIPVAVLGGAADAAPLMLSGNPCAGFLFSAAPGGESAGHIYYLPDQKGFVDAGFFDGARDVTYDVYAGTVDRFEWSSVLYDVYQAQNLWLTRGPKPFTAVTAEDFPERAPKSYRRLLEAAGVNSLGTGTNSMFMTEAQIEEAAKWVPQARKEGYKVWLWTNIWMAPDLDGHGRNHDPLLDYRNFKDSWITNDKGEPLECWDGYMCTSAMKYSFARFCFDRLTKWTKKYGYDGIFLDFYGVSSDVEYGRTYAHFPFYPHQVGMIEYTKALSDWCVANDKILVLNCPHPSLMVWDMGNNFQGDTQGPAGDTSLVEKLACAASGHAHTLLGPLRDTSIPGEWLWGTINAVYYGEIPTPWRWMINRHSPEQFDIIIDLFGRNHELAMRVGLAKMAGGNRAGTQLYYTDDDGAYIMLRNRTDDLVTAEKVRPAEVAALPDGESVTILWDMVSPPVVLENQEEYNIMLAPGEVKGLLVVTPESAEKLLHNSSSY